MQNRALMLISIVVVAILFFGATYFYKDNKESSSVTLTQNNKEILLRDYSIRHGENGKNISVVEFLDPECESCAIFHTAIKKLYKEYYKDIQIVTKYIPNHKNSIFAIKLLEATREQGLYDEALDIIFSNQELWAKHNSEKPELLWDFLATIPNMDIEKLEVDMKNPKIEDIIKQDKEDATKLQVLGTPTLFIDGVILPTLSQKALFDMVEERLLKETK